jgi:hypothetical protein
MVWFSSGYVLYLEQNVKVSLDGRNPFGLAVGLLGLGLAMLTACSPSGESTSVAPEQQIESRAEARWAALSKGDFEVAYGFESPAFREVTPLERFRGLFGSQVKWHGAEVKEVNMQENGDAAELVLSLDYTSPMPVGQPQRMTRGVKETWILADGEWWFLRD